MNTTNAISALPPILDFEASSLSDGCYPITAGLVVNGEVNYWIIKPQLDWIDWSLASQSIHGIKRSYLMEHGVDASQVYDEMKSLLCNSPIVYSDNPYWESRWLGCLGKFDCEVRDIRELFPKSLHDHFSVCLENQLVVNKLTRHRADHDANALFFAVSELRRLSPDDISAHTFR
jgi:hypothetical protein